jgi:hypothetical protein
MRFFRRGTVLVTLRVTDFLTRSVRSTAWLLVCAAMVLALVGCETLNAPMKDAQSRRKRNEELVRDMDQRRDAAELLAARERYQRGELTEARQTLARLLARNPEHADAQALLAVVTRAEQQAAGERKAVQADATGPPAAHTARIPTERPAPGAVKRAVRGPSGDNENSTSDDETAPIRRLLGRS